MTEMAGSTRRDRRQATELHTSRARLVAARDTGWRRLERDLHDGVQQDIVSLLSRLGPARTQLRRDPAAAEATLAELQAPTGEVLRDLLRLVRDIHPSARDDRGLLEATRATASARAASRCTGGS